MKKYIVLLVFLFSAMSSYAIIPPNPDMCLDCDSVPWTTGTLTFTYNYTDDDGNPASCDIIVGYGYRFCNGAIDTYIDRLFLPPGSCYTYVRNLPGFYERCENELTIKLSIMLDLPSTNGSSYAFNHWRPGSCNYICWKIDNVQQMMVGEIRSCSQNYYCCVEQIIANKDENGLLLTDYQPAQYEACDDYPDNHFDCDYASDCIIECR